MATEECEWQIVSGPGKFDFAVAYFRGEKIELCIKQTDKHGTTNVAVRINSAYPRLGSERDNWIIWGELWLGNRTAPLYIHGSYYLKGSHKGWFDFVTKDQHDFQDLDR